MYINFTKKTNAVKRSHIENIIRFCVLEMLNEKDWTGLEIEVNITKSTADGFCEYTDTNFSPKAFTLEINKDLKGDELVKTVIHEMVHVKQYVKGQLKERYKPNHHHLWYKEMIIVNDDNFFDVPWEVEARELEEILFERYTQQNAS